MPYVGKQILTITVLTRSRRWTGVHGPPLVRGLGVGVGQLMRTAVEKANPVRADIKLDGCGEHGGDPESVKFCHRIDLDYVSCSPFRVPIARLAAAQAAIGDGIARDK